MSKNELPVRSQVVKTFGSEAADFLEHAAALGWKIVLNSTGTSITLVPFDQSYKRIHLSSRNKNKGALRKHIKTLVRYADPACRDAATLLAESDSIPEEAKALLYSMQGAQNIAKNGGVLVMHEDEPEPKRPRKAKKETPVSTPAQPKPKPPPSASVIPSPAQVAERVTQERHIVSQRPTMMHYSLTQQGGRSYPSQTTMERHWSDGAVDYQCVCCKDVSESRRAFGGAHWAMHVRKGEALPVSDEEKRRNLVDDPNYTEPAWTRKANLKEKRLAELKNLLDGIDLAAISAEDLAEQIMEFLGDMSGGGGGGLGEPLTDSQLVDRIRTMVDRGTYSQQETAIRERDQRLEDLTATAEAREAELNQKILESEQRAIRAESTMGAFFELVQEMKPEEK